MSKRKKPSISLTCILLCKNRLIKEYIVSATRKFNIGDETYVIKKECCYPRIRNNIFSKELVSYYVEGNPNPFDLRHVEKNKGLKAKELDGYIAGDIFNIIMECRKRDKTKYILTMAVFIFILGFVRFFMWLLFRL